MSNQQFEKMLQGYSLTTAEIIYRLPDHHSILQSYIWQDYDMFPELPNLHKFLDFWQTKLDGPLHSVRVAHQHLITPSEVRLVTKEFLLN